MSGKQVSRAFERQGLLVRGRGHRFLTLDAPDVSRFAVRLGPSITYRMARGPSRDRLAFSSQTLAALAAVLHRRALTKAAGLRWASGPSPCGVVCGCAKSR